MVSSHTNHMLIIGLETELSSNKLNQTLRAEAAWLRSGGVEIAVYAGTSHRVMFWPVCRHGDGGRGAEAESRCPDEAAGCRAAPAELFTRLTQ